MTDAKPRRRYLPRGGMDWPARLEDLAHLPGWGVPKGLWVEGDVDFEAPMIAIVGARRASVAGLEVAHEIARQLAAQSVTIVSGFAVGIDAAAHRGALDGDGRTVAVLGCGLEQRYPREHDALRQRIGGAGALLSEYEEEDPPQPWRFPKRNRIIAALARAVVVVEAAAWSGALSTARWALDLGREVLAVPGGIQGGGTTGSNRLIRDGARPYLEPADLAEALPERALAPSVDRPPRASGPDQLLLDLLGSAAVHPDQLGAATGLRPAELAAHLTEMELAGTIRTLPGGLIQRLRCRQ